MRISFEIGVLYCVSRRYSMMFDNGLLVWKKMSQLISWHDRFREEQNILLLCFLFIEPELNKRNENFEEMPPIFFNMNKCGLISRSVFPKGGNHPSSMWIVWIKLDRMPPQKIKPLIATVCSMRFWMKSAVLDLRNK